MTAALLLGVPLGLPWLLGALLALLDGRSRRVGLVAVAGLVIGFGGLLALTLVVLKTGAVVMVAGGWPEGLGIAFRADALGVVFATVSVGVILAALTHEVLAGVRWRGYPAIVLLGAAGLTGLFLTGDLFSFYVFFEITMTSAFILASYRRADYQVSGAFQFAVVNLLGSTIFLIAIVALYTITGTLDIEMIAVRANQLEAGTHFAIATLMLAAFSLKLGMFPFHFWLPSVYIGSHPSVAAILSGALANIGAYGLLRFGGSIFERELVFAVPVIISLGTASLVYGALQAVARRDASEVLAYSAIGQAGYIMLALGIGGPAGFAAAIVYSAVNSLNKSALFLANDLRGPLAAVAFAVGAFSVAGIPPAAGYLGKLMVYRALIGLPRLPAAVLISLTVLGSALSILYMFQTYQRSFAVPDPESVRQQERVSLFRYIPTLSLAALLIMAGLWPEPLLAAATAAATAALGAPP